MRMATRKRTRLTRAEQQSQTRAALLDAAVRVFVKLGFHGANIEAITADAGYTPGAFYSNFALDEDEIVLADGHRTRTDVVIAATGYRCGLEPLIGHLPGVLRTDGRPAISGARHVPGAPGLFTIGFQVPVSGQLPELRRDARAIGTAITQRGGTARKWGRNSQRRATCTPS